MKSLRDKVLIAAGAVFMLGAGYIVYAGRPVITNPAPVTGSQGTATPYAMADVQAHAAQSACWTTIGGNVYDLTEWIGRHPGGPQAIIGLCGVDGSDAFTAQHGRSRRAQSELGLLQIGILK